MTKSMSPTPTPVAARLFSKRSDFIMCQNGRAGLGLSFPQQVSIRMLWCGVCTR